MLRYPTTLVSLLQEYVYILMCLVLQQWGLKWGQRHLPLVIYYLFSAFTCKAQNFPRYHINLFVLPDDYSPTLDQNFFSVTKLKWVVSNWASLCIYQVTACYFFFSEIVTVFGTLYWLILPLCKLLGVVIFRNYDTWGAALKDNV